MKKAQKKAENVAKKLKANVVSATSTIQTPSATTIRNRAAIQRAQTCPESCREEKKWNNAKIANNYQGSLTAIKAEGNIQRLPAMLALLCMCWRSEAPDFESMNPKSTKMSPPPFLNLSGIPKLSTTRINSD